MFCKNCGKQIAEGAEFCNYCGAGQRIKQEKKNEKLNLLKVLCLALVVVLAGIAIITVWKMNDSEVKMNDSEVKMNDSEVKMNDSEVKMNDSKMIMLLSEENDIIYNNNDEEESRSKIKANYGKIVKDKDDQIIVEGSYIFEPKKGKDGKIIEEGEILHYKWTYDSQSKQVLKRILFYDVSGVYTVYEYKYDKYGIIEKAVEQSADQEGYEKSETHSYDINYEEKDTQGNPIKAVQTEIDSDYYTEYTLEDGKIVKNERYNSDRELISQEIYDKYGNVVEAKYVHEDGFLKCKMIYKEFNVE